MNGGAHESRSSEIYRPNILLITCDQLRFDVLGCSGNGSIETPNIDRLAREGVLVENYFVQNPICQPSRATLTTGRYPHVHGTKGNWYDLRSSERTLPATLSENGYSTHAVGKMHFEPLEELHGFDDRVFVEGKMFTGDDDYRLYLDSLDLRETFESHISQWRDKSHFGALTSPLTDEHYIDTYIGNRAIETLNSLARPFFMWTSFVNPHMPVDPPPPFDTMYDPKAVPLPSDWPVSDSPRIPEHRISSAGQPFESLTEEQLRNVRSHYYGAVSLVDREVGRLLDLLRNQGRLDDTIVLFTADHGDLLGNRGMLWKGGRMFYDHLLHVPMIVRYPNELPQGTVVSDLCEATDVMPTLLDYASVNTPPGVQGHSLRPVLRQDPVSNWRDAVFAESMEVKMLRDHNWKLIFYPHRKYGELYNLQNDPQELTNLYDEPQYSDRRTLMIERLAARLIEVEDPLPLPTRRPGYFEASGFHSEQELMG